MKKRADIRFCVVIVGIFGILSFFLISSKVYGKNETGSTSAEQGINDIKYSYTEGIISDNSEEMNSDVHLYEDYYTEEHMSGDFVMDDTSVYVPAGE